MKYILKSISLIFRLLTPPSYLRLPVVVLLGIFVGLAGYAFYISNAASYLSDDPKTCMNCHVMTPQYAAWEHGSHSRVASCNDCHVPHDNVFNKYLFKAKDGTRHATIFTLRSEPQVIIIKEDGRRAVQDNCIRCHANVVDDVNLNQIAGHGNYKEDSRVCWDCHRATPHGTVRSLSSTPYALVPQLPSVAPEWIKEFLEKK